VKDFCVDKVQCVSSQLMVQLANALQVNLEIRLLVDLAQSINVQLKDLVNHHKFALMGVANTNAMELFVALALNVTEILVVAFVSHFLLEIPITFVCHQYRNLLAIHSVVSMLIVNMEHQEVYVFVIQEVMEIHMKDVDLKKKENANQQLVEKELNVEKDLTFWNVFAHLVTMEIHILAVLISMNVLHKFAVNKQFALTLQEVMIVVAAKVMLEIHLRCVLQLKEVSVPIQRVASAAKMFNVRVDLNVNEEFVKIFARRLNVVQEQLAMLELVFVLLVLMEIQMIQKKVAQCLDNVKLISIVVIVKSVSEIFAVSENVSMAAVNYNVVQIHFA
jgi:hypothetical protein